MLLFLVGDERMELLSRRPWTTWMQAVPKVERGPPVGVAGLNHLYGDGRVVWKPGKTMEREKISPQNSNIGLVRGYSGTATFY